MILKRNETRLERNETRLERKKTRLERNDMRLARNERRSGNIHLSGTVHNLQIVHSDLKSNNVPLEKQMESQWNPVIIDFGKARFITDPKPLMSLMASSQESYKRRYLHIAPENVAGSGQLSVLSVFFLRKNCSRNSKFATNSYHNIVESC